MLVGSLPATPANPHTAVANGREHKSALHIFLETLWFVCLWWCLSVMQVDAVRESCNVW